jgi:CMP-N-acetylneuraminic acid synthetase
MSILGIILARAGSKRLPGKNTKILCGKPLIEYTIDAAIESGVIDTLVVSTDDEKVKEACYNKYGFVKNHVCLGKGERLIIERPDYLATDNAPSEEAILHAMDQVEKHDYVMLLQATSPLRTSKDIQLFETSYKIHMADDMASFNKRTGELNGAIYMIAWDKLYGRRKLCNHGHDLFEMPEERSIDVDTELDFKIAEMLIKAHDEKRS